VKNLFEFVVYVLTVLFILIAVVFCILICGKLIKDINDLSKKPTVNGLSMNGSIKVDPPIVEPSVVAHLITKPSKIDLDKKPIKKVKNSCNDPDYVCLDQLTYATVSTETPLATNSTGTLRVTIAQPKPDPCQAFYDGAMLTGEHPFDADGIPDRALNAQLYLVCREHFKSQGLN
jgi:hypothetical protein